MYITPGTYTFIVPAGVTSVCMVAVGAGAGAASDVDGLGSAYCGGGGGGLVYQNNVSVTPGATYTVVVGSYGGLGSDGGDTTISGTGVSITAGGGTTNSKSRFTSGGDVANYGGCSSYNYSASGTLYVGGPGNASYTYNETNTTPYQSSGGSAIGGSVTVGGVFYSQGFAPLPYQFSVSLNGTTGTTNYVGTGGNIYRTTSGGGGILVGAAGLLDGGVRIIWGTGRSYPGNAL